MEPLPFKEQIKVYASSQVLLMTHGAALVNIMFMPKVESGLSPVSEPAVTPHLIWFCTLSASLGWECCRCP